MHKSAHSRFEDACASQEIIYCAGLYCRPSKWAVFASSSLHPAASLSISPNERFKSLAMTRAATSRRVARGVVFDMVRCILLNLSPWLLHSVWPRTCEPMHMSFDFPGWNSDQGCYRFRRDAVRMRCYGHYSSIQRDRSLSLYQDLRS